MSNFTHLHVHTHYSTLDGMSKITPLLKKAKELGMTAIAITDHGNMHGVKEFHDVATGKKEGINIKPIIGCEVYVVKNRFEKDKEEKAGDHLVLLAKNLEGYHNLIKIVSYSYTEGFYYKPRIDKELLRNYNKGLICSSACLGGELPQAIMRGNMDDANKIVAEFKEIFGDDYYLEMQLHKSSNPEKDEDVYANQLKVNKTILELSTTHGVKYIASNDVHFINADDALAHDRLICLSTGKTVDDPKRMRYTQQEYLKSYDEMLELFAEHPEALSNTQEIADKVEIYSLKCDPLMPNFPLPKDFSPEQKKVKELFLRKLEKNKADKEKLLKKIQEKANESNKEIDSKKIEEGIYRQEKGSLIEIESIIDEVKNCTDYNSFAEKHPQTAETLTVIKQHLYLTHLTQKGAEERYGAPIPQNIQERIDYELSVIEKMGFPGYFLIVWDFVRVAREIGVSVGPGRGSAAGSVIAYCLYITKLDPIAYELLFERFLNPDRISMPDVDIDFDEDGRKKVLNYVIEKYGQKRVAQVVTFGTMAPKNAIRDVARVQNLAIAESNRLAKLVPNKIKTQKKEVEVVVNGEKRKEKIKETPFERVFIDSPDLAAEKKSNNPIIRDTLLFAEKLEGTIRQTGVHACGIVIGPDDLENFAPICTTPKNDLNIVQFEGSQIEKVGLIKMDFLGLTTLSIIKDTIENVEISTGKTIDIDTVSFDDKKTYELYGRGETTGIFQFESPGMKQYLRQLKPNNIEDLIAMNALYRPGPIAKIPNYIARKNGTEKIEYALPEMEEYLRYTYGITVYQEQVMMLSQKLAGFSGGQADTLRKAMGKKDEKLLADLKKPFFEGTAKNGHPQNICEEIWAEWQAFAEYAFNRSHAACYAYLSFHTAFLKAHYPAEFMAANLSRNLTDINKIKLFMEECKRMGIPVLGPDINHSNNKFTVDKKGNIRFGLSGVKNVGKNAVDHIVEERKKGEFKDLYDFFERVDNHIVNKRNIEAFVESGAFDCFDIARSAYFAEDNRNAGQIFIDTLQHYGTAVKKGLQSNQLSLFGDSETTIVKPAIPKTEAWNANQQLKQEFEKIGIYLSAHPLDKYKFEITQLTTVSTQKLQNLNDLAKTGVIFAGKIISAQSRKSSNDKDFGTYEIEDYSGTYRFNIFGESYKKFLYLMLQDNHVIIKANVELPKWKKDKDPNARHELKILQIYSLDDKNLLTKLSDKITIEILLSTLSKDMITELKKYKTSDKKGTSVKFNIINDEDEMNANEDENVEVNVNNEDENTYEIEENSLKNFKSIKLYSSTLKMDLNQYFKKLIEDFGLRIIVEP